MNRMKKLILLTLVSIMTGCAAIDNGGTTMENKKEETTAQKTRVAEINEGDILIKWAPGMTQLEGFDIEAEKDYEKDMLMFKVLQTNIMLNPEQYEGEVVFLFSGLTFTDSNNSALLTFGLSNRTGATIENISFNLSLSEVATETQIVHLNISLSEVGEVKIPNNEVHFLIIEIPSLSEHPLGTTYLTSDIEGTAYDIAYDTVE